jgi:hypothetical protein
MPLTVESIRRASEVARVQPHRIFPDRERSAEETEEAERLLDAFTELARIEEEVKARVAAMFASYGLGDAGFRVSLDFDADPR